MSCIHRQGVYNGFIGVACCTSITKREMMIMYGLFGQDSRGLQWIATMDTLEEAKANAADTAKNDEYDAVFIVKLEHFIDTQDRV